MTVLAVFRSRSQTLDFLSRLRSAGVPSQAVNTPREAGVGCGIYGSYGEAVNRTIRMTRVQEPNPENKAVYDRAMERYLRLYEDLKEGFSL